MQLKDKVIVITGGAQGLGLAMAECFAAKGARLALVDLNDERLAAAVATCKAIGGDAKAYKAMLDNICRNPDRRQNAGQKYWANGDTLLQSMRSGEVFVAMAWDGGGWKAGNCMNPIRPSILSRPRRGHWGGSIPLPSRPRRKMWMPPSNGSIICHRLPGSH